MKQKKIVTNLFDYMLTVIEKFSFSMSDSVFASY